MNYYNDYARNYYYEYPEREIIYDEPIYEYRPIKEYSNHHFSDFTNRQNYYVEYEVEKDDVRNQIESRTRIRAERDLDHHKPKCSKLKSLLKSKPKKKLRKPDYAKLSNKSSGKNEMNNNDKLEIDKQTSNVKSGESKFSVEESEIKVEMGRKKKEENCSGSSQEEEVIEWRNYSMPDTTTDSNTQSSHSNIDKKGSATLSSDCITVNSEEYHEFINQISKIPQITRKDVKEKMVEDDVPPGIGTILKSFYDSTSKTPPNGIKKSPIHSRHNITIKSRQGDKKIIKRGSIRSISEINVKINPLNDVPLLHLFKWMTPGENCNCQCKNKKTQETHSPKHNSILIRIVRVFVDLIGKVQLFTYRYALRYILFI